MKVGILGGGQLGMMLAQAGEKIGVKCRFLDPANDAPARKFGEHVCAAFEDIDALEAFHPGLDAITYEFENVPIQSVKWLAQRVPVHPPPDALGIAQDRLFEKQCFAQLGIPIPKFETFFFRDEYDAAVTKIGFPAVLKTRRFGYDGKGQRVLRSAEDAEKAWKDLNGIPLFLEGFVPFKRELSLIAVRSREGDFRAWPLVENHHRDGILRLSIAPAAAVGAELQAKAERHARAIMEHLAYVGVLAVEFFQTESGELLANEMAPRVHNSGHWTIEGAGTSQFENHLRAICGMELGSTNAVAATAMINIVGEHAGTKGLDCMPSVTLHDYGKHARAGRKLGHITVMEGSIDRLIDALKTISMANHHLIKMDDYSITR